MRPGHGLTRIFLDNLPEETDQDYLKMLFIDWK